MSKLIHKNVSQCWYSEKNKKITKPFSQNYGEKKLCVRMLEFLYFFQNQFINKCACKVGGINRPDVRTEFF